jgi:hypothetical protein
LQEHNARGLGNEAPPDPTLERIIAFSELASLGHSVERLKQLAPKVKELYSLIEKIRSADVSGHEMTVNYWTALESNVSTQSTPK